jgi:hypothetical protein
MSRYHLRQEKKEMEQPTARGQFVADYTLVTDNDQEAYREALDIAHKAGGSVVKASEKFKEQFEDYISQVVEREREQGNTTGADLISQMLIGYGSDSFDDIARHYIDTELETRLYDRFTSRLKTEATK